MTNYLEPNDSIKVIEINNLKDFTIYISKTIMLRIKHIKNQY